MYRYICYRTYNKEKEKHVPIRLRSRSLALLLLLPEGAHPWAAGCTCTSGAASPPSPGPACSRPATCQPLGRAAPCPRPWAAAPSPLARRHHSISSTRAQPTRIRPGLPWISTASSYFSFSPSRRTSRRASGPGTPSSPARKPLHPATIAQATEPCF